MYVALAAGHESGDETAILMEANDFTRLHVAAPQSWDATRIDAVLRRAGAGYVHDSNAWLSVDWIAAAEASAADTGWRNDLFKMLDYARSKGWVTLDEAAVQAHIQFDVTG